MNHFIIHIFYDEKSSKTHLVVFINGIHYFFHIYENCFFNYFVIEVLQLLLALSYKTGYNIIGTNLIQMLTGKLRRRCSTMKINYIFQQSD